MKRIFKIIIGILIFIVSLEILMRVFAIGSVYSERTAGWYLSYYNYQNTLSHHSWSPNSTIKYKQPEFEYSFMSNSDGFREVEFPKNNIDSLDIVYVLGDSFVEGDGAPYDSAMPRFLERKFHKFGYSKVKVFNIGVCGNDPIFSYQFFKDRLLSTDPKLVILVTNSSDEDDLVYRGGFERYTPDGGVAYKKAPFGHLLYRFSRISRVFFHSAGWREGMLPPYDDIDYQDIDKMIKDVFVKMDSLTRHNDIKFAGFVHPFPNQDARQEAFFKYGKSIQKMLLAENDSFPIFDICPPIADSISLKSSRYYGWPINGHFNSRGYEMMANVIFNDLKSKPAYFNVLRRDSILIAE